MKYIIRNNKILIVGQPRKLTKEMVEYWLEENYHKWIANVIVDICNEPHDINHLKKQIKKEWEVRNI